jgi:cell division transport system permease protein
LAFRPSYIALEAVKGFRRNFLLALSMIIIVAISLTLLGIALLAGKQAALYRTFWYGKVEVSVFLTQDVTPDQRAAIQQQLESMPIVQRVYYESKQDAYNHFKDEFKDSPDMVRNVSASALPESFRVKLHDPRQFALVHDQFCKPATDSSAKETCTLGIDQVLDQRQLVNRLFTVLDLIRNSFYVLAGVLGVAAIVLIAVTVRVAAFARRRETSIMKLVGASSTYIRLPFLAEGVLAGLIGSLISFGLLRVGVYYISKLHHSVPFLQAQPMVGTSAFYSAWLLLFALGIGVSAVASMLALRKYVRV